MENCPMCGGEGTILGQLGNLVWFRCRNCGMDFSISDVVSGEDITEFFDEEETE